MRRLAIDALFFSALFTIASVSYAEELPPVTEEGLRAMAAVDEVWAHMAEGDVEKTLAGHLLPSDPELLKYFTRTLEAQSELLESGAIQIRSVYARVQGDWALVPIHFTMKRGEEVSTAVAECWVYRQPDKQGDEGAWKIVSEGMMRDDAIKPLRNDDLKTLQEWWHEHAEQLQQLKPKKKQNKEGQA